MSQAFEDQEMSKDMFDKYGAKLVSILSCCLIVLLILAVWLHIKDTSDITENTTAPTIEKNPDSIAVPGYEMLELKANSKTQTLCLPNPEQNMCYFQISLYLEDGTLLWKSELIEPGKTSEPIVLAERLSKGTYPKAVLRYACYRMDEDLTPLNGAETKVTLWVK